MSDRYNVTTASADGKLVVTLNDSISSVEVSVCPSMGGQIVGLRHLEEELIYRGMQLAAPADGEWSGHAPVLFPAVGRQAEGKYAFPPGAPPRDMPLHGFASRMPFEVESMRAESAGGACVRLTARAACPAVHEALGLDLAAVYPWNFRLSIEYRLAEGRLLVTHTIAHAHEPLDTPCSLAADASARSTDAAAGPDSEAASSQLMPAAIGNHITFAFPFHFAFHGSSSQAAAAPASTSASGSCTAAEGWAAGRLTGSTSTELHLKSGSLLAGTAAPVPELQPGAGGLPLTAPLATNGVLALPGVSAAERAHARCAMRLEQPGVLAVELEQWVTPIRRSGLALAASGSGDVGAAASAAASSSSDAAASTEEPARPSWEEVSAERLFVLWGQPPAPRESAAAGAPGGGFICVEPWLTGPDSLNTRLGLLQLLPGEEIEWSFSVRPVSVA